MTGAAREVAFDSAGNEIVGDLWLPDGFDGRRQFPAVVLSTPGSSVKGQIGANYSRKLADEGFVALTFDPSHQGQSAGEPRDLEDPATRIEDLRCAIDLLTTMGGVDVEGIGMLGICAGGGYAVRAAAIDHRVAALGTVVAVDVGRAMRQAAEDSDTVTGVLEEVGRQRTAEARGGDLRRDPWIPDTVEQAREAGISDRDVLDALDFYRTPRGYDEHSTNQILFRSMATLIGFNAFDLVDELLSQPVQVIVAGRRGSTGSYDDGVRLQGLASHAEELVVIDGAGHYDLYDKAVYVDQATERLSDFFSRHLGEGVPGPGSTSSPSNLRQGDR